jgi:hypothetical protein
MTEPVSPLAAGFDPFTGAYHRDPAGALALARRQEPVFYSPRIDSWVVTRYADIRRVFGDPAGFSAGNVLDPLVQPGRAALRALARHGFAGGPVLANEDGPGHRSRRRRLLRPLSRPQVAGWEPRVRQLVREQLDRFVHAGPGDLVAGLLWEVPARVVFEFLGVPDDQLPEAMEFAVDLSRFTWGRPDQAEQVRGAELLGRYWRFTGRLLERHRRERRATGWLGYALRAQRRSPDLFDDRYLRALVMNGSTAGHEPVANAAANAVRTLLEHPPAWRALAADPALIPGTVTECLRFRSPVVAWRRRAVRATELAGVPIPAGATLLLVTASGNHDPAAFADPDRFDPGRPDAGRHLSFGYGNHRCLGAPLALLQLRVILEELVARLPALRLAGGQRFDHPPNTSFFGPDQLRVWWDRPAGRRAAPVAGRYHAGMGDKPVAYLGATPYLYYEDASMALDWLARVFGFEELARYVDPDGMVMEAEMRAGGTVVQLCGYTGYFAERGGTGPVGQENILHVDDVDAHWARATAAGGQAEPPEDKPYGVRAYGITDPGGHRWNFWQRLTDRVDLPEGWREIRPGSPGSG